MTSKIDPSAVPAVVELPVVASPSAVENSALTLNMIASTALDDPEFALRMLKNFNGPIELLELKEAVRFSAMYEKRQNMKSINEFTLHDKFWKNLDSLLPGAIRIDAKSRNGHIPDGFIELNNQSYVVEVKLEKFDAKALKQLCRYMREYSAKGIAVARHQACKLPSDIIFIQLSLDESDKPYTRPPIQSRSQLSFRTINPETGEAVSALECSDATWDVPRGLPKNQADQLGRQYFAEWLELAKNNPEEAKSALTELFLYGWKTPFEILPDIEIELHTVEGIGQVPLLPLDAFTNPALISDCQVEWSFLEALAGAALGGGV